MSDESPHVDVPIDPRLQAAFDGWWERNKDRYEPHLKKDIFLILKNGWDLREQSGFAERAEKARYEKERQAYLKALVLAVMTGVVAEWGYDPDNIEGAAKTVVKRAILFAEAALKELEARCDE